MHTQNTISGMRLTFDLISDWFKDLKYGLKKVPGIVLGWREWWNPGILNCWFWIHYLALHPVVWWFNWVFLFWMLIHVLPFCCMTISQGTLDLTTMSFKPFFIKAFLLQICSIRQMNLLLTRLLVSKCSVFFLMVYLYFFVSLLTSFRVGNTSLTIFISYFVPSVCDIISFWNFWNYLLL